MKRIQPVLYAQFEQEKIERFLGKKAEKGWILEKINGLFWTFCRTEPKTLLFSVIYDPKTSGYDPEPTEAQRTYRDFCRETGWEFVCGFREMQIFCTAEPEPVPLETEPMMALEAMETIIGRRLWPESLLLALIALCNCLELGTYFRHFPLEVLSSTPRLVRFGLSVFILLAVAVNAAAYLISRGKAARRAEQGEFPRPAALVCAVPTLLVLGAMAAMIVFENGLLLILASILLYGVLHWAISGIGSFRKADDPSKRGKRLAKAVIPAVLAVFLVSLLVFGLMRAGDTGFLGRKPQNDGVLTPVLTVEELMETDYDGYETEYGWNNSILLGLRWGRQYDPNFEAASEEPGLRYQIVYVKAPFLYDYCKDTLLSARDQRYDKQVVDYYKTHYEQVNAEPWGAVSAYQVFSKAPQSTQIFLLCYGDRIVELELGWEPTAEQIAVIANRLG